MVKSDYTSSWVDCGDICFEIKYVHQIKTKTKKNVIW